ncbi:hypothetical protein ABHF54_00125 [Nitrosomonas europaea]|uniref:hypothetical protein n=1 Tax=Nitrosomonas europaea TaxID=915 RepID=UPI003265E284
MKKILFVFLVSASSFINASELDIFELQKASILDVGLLALENHFTREVDIGLSLYREGFISLDGIQYLSQVRVGYGDINIISKDKGKIVLKIDPPYFNIEFLNKIKGISRNNAIRLANAYFNAVRENLGINYNENGSVKSDMTYAYLGKWFSSRDVDISTLEKNSEKIKRNIVLRTIIQNVSQVGALFCEANGFMEKTTCKMIGE